MHVPRPEHIVCATVVALASGTALAAAAETPTLTAVSAQRGHVVVDARLTPDEAPYQVEVATSSRLLATGFPQSALVLRERLPTETTGKVHYRTHAGVKPGRYWVAVSARLLDATSCMPIKPGADCNVAWSRAVPLRVR
jgi:hypothetical protein